MSNLPTTPHDAIEVQHLTKQFTWIHRKGSLKSDTLGALKRGLLSLLGKGGEQKRVEHYTALDDISFSVPHGQTVAVIGRNGSGKSTLLGILARVYRVTSGSAMLYNPEGGPARIAPLLALEAGFHPDLTGLENIDFYGAVLGMSRKMIQDRKQEIIAFAELETKVDTAVRGWNDGAKLRLGFSIAVHTDPDILLVDEVLAVGDEAFQNKCYRLIAKLQAQGKTILFVSHDLDVVERVANRIIWLNKGVIRMDGDASTVLRAYREDASQFATK
ncbi:MAG TPA: ABC transporter ATP-binding protein [Chthonomonadaceae bacterium]|nr:ABC transporter ATP-binding protein [Chthonomonadaceae bacterium]